MEKYLKISGTSNKSGASQQKIPAQKGVKRNIKKTMYSTVLLLLDPTITNFLYALFAILPCQMRPSFLANSADT